MLLFLRDWRGALIVVTTIPVALLSAVVWLETLIPAGYGDMARVAGEFRAAVKEKLPDTTARRLFWEELLSGPFAERAMNGQADAARALAQQALAAADAAALTKGEVFLVGAGPGDPDLLTFRALRLMQMADVVLYDNLYPAEGHWAEPDLDVAAAHLRALADDPALRQRLAVAGVERLRRDDVARVGDVAARRLRELGQGA